MNSHGDNALVQGPPDPSNPAMWKFMETVWNELASMFPDPYISLGGGALYIHVVLLQLYSTY